MTTEATVVTNIVNDVAVVAALQQKIVADRLAIEEAIGNGLPLIEGASERAETLSSSLWGMTTENRQINTDITQRYNEIKSWHDAHDADKLQLTTLKQEMVVLHQSVEDSVNQNAPTSLDGGSF
ncbi:hypothetical protein [Salinisphaera sp. G21_0]|uniref:hypothetical protein n=1 Tax=Salinisphaera sp. G21_0 TaxID=2821094 RepID=UPI001ADA69C9|nr:hypothetical protein [Salinisphaera sp. G21_0]MBO9484026.1 hypothetical protein [Salinisphaera sp. G21_0]